MPVIDLGSVIGPQGPQGVAGQTGAQGIQGNPGPNQVTGSTSTTLAGILQGNGSVIQAVASDTKPVEGSANIVRSGAVFAAQQKHPRPNLFDNSFFVGGGTGNGVFPVCQKGWAGSAARSLTGAGYLADRWYSFNADQVTSVQSDGLHISNNAGLAIIQQWVELPTLPVGTALTTSVLYKGQLRIRDNFSGSTRGTNYYDTAGSAGLLTLTTTVGAGGPASGSYAWFTAPQGIETTIYAVKLEIGPDQTLVSTDDQGNFFLTEVPNFEVELAKCQRYMQVLNPALTTQHVVGSGYGQNATTAYMLIPTPVTLRGAPTIYTTGVPILQAGSSRVDSTAIGHYRTGLGAEIVSVTAESGITDGKFYMLLFGASNVGTIILDANIYPA